MTQQQQDLVFGLIHQVIAARPPGKSERDVTTIITRPMWKAFMIACGEWQYSNPTGWNGNYTKRVYGSETIVVESDKMASVSFVK